MIVYSEVLLQVDHKTERYEISLSTFTGESDRVFLGPVSFTSPSNEEVVILISLNRLNTFLQFPYLA
jgi:hypothetical protein